MAIYQYRNSMNELREVVASMKNPPPEWMLLKDGQLVPQGESQPMRQTGPGDFEFGPDIFRRVYTNPAVSVSRGSEVSHAAQDIPQASRSLPRTHEQGEIVSRFGQSVRKLANGAYATLDGRRIVDSDKARDAHCKETGFVPGD